jgi:hypothetical protein
VTANAIQTASPRQWISLVVVYLSIPLVLLACGGDFGWLAERHDIEKIQSSEAWDKVLAPLMALSLSFPLVIVAGLDHRYGWSPAVPLWLSVLGFILISS